MPPLSQSFNQHFNKCVAAAARLVGATALVASTLGLTPQAVLATANPSARGPNSAAAGSLVGPGGIDTNLKLWLRAGDVNASEGGVVNQWNDASGNNYNLTADFGGGPQYYANTPWRTLNYNPSLFFFNNRLTNPNRFYGNTSPFQVIVVADDARGDPASRRAPLGIGHEFSDGDYPAFDVQYDWYTPGGWNPYMAFGHEEWPGSTVTLGKHRPIIYSLSSPNVAGGSEAMTSNINGTAETTNHRVFGQTGIGKGIYVGGSGLLDASWVGGVGEVIVFDRVLSAAELQKVNTYLAIKYGTTLKNGATPLDYVSSNSTTVWNATTNAAYHNNIAGLGRDDASGLDQRRSSSWNEVTPNGLQGGAVAPFLTLAHSGAFGADQSFMLWGDNGGALVYGQATGTNVYLNRVWKVQETGTVGNVTVQVPAGSATALWQDADGDFSSGAIATPLTGGQATVDFANGQYFTFARAVSAAPGGVAANLQLWLRGDAGTYTDSNCTLPAASGLVGCWRDQSSAGNNAFEANTALNPDYYGNQFNNGYPGIHFNGIPNVERNTLNTTSNLGLQGTNDLAIFTVFKLPANSWARTILGPTGSGDGGVQYRVNAAGNMEIINEQLGSLNIAGTTPVADNTPKLTTLRRASNNFSLFVNGAADGAGGSSGVAFSDTPLRIGEENNGFLDNTWESFYGEIAEVIVYNSAHNPNATLRIESYLALKYGITKADEYTDSGGANTWDNTVNAAYHNRITGIGRDDFTALDQAWARSVHAGNLLTLQKTTPIFATDKSFLIVGDDNGALTGTTEVPGGYFQRLARAWVVEERGETDNVTLTFDLSGVSSPAPDFSNLGGFKLLVDSDGNFSNANVTGTVTVAGNLVTVSGVNLSDGQYFSLAYPSTGDASMLVGIAAVRSSPALINSNVYFTAGVTYGSPVTYTWSFGDGSTGAGGLAQHAYGAPGTYTAVVTATNAINFLVYTLTVQVDAPITGLTATANSPIQTGFTTHYTASVTAGSNVFYSWNYGDGTSGTGITSTHAYAAPGTYTTTVIAYNGAGLATATTFVTVIAAPNCYATINATTVYSSTDSQAVRDAVNAAASGDTVKVAGYCAGTVSGNLAVITKTLTIRGAYTYTNWTTQQLGVYTTTLDGVNTGRVFSITTAPVTLDGLYITHGYFAAANNDKGGGVYANSGLTLTNSYVVSNTASTSGGGVHVAGGALTVQNSVFDDNYTRQGSGAALGFESTGLMTLQDSRFLNNRAYASGGALYAFNGQSIIRRTTFSGNDASRLASTAGGAILLLNHTMLIDSSSFVLNRAGAAGAIATLNSQLQITGTQITSNTVVFGDGGGLQVIGGAVTVTNSYLGNNVSALRGGAIYQNTGALSLNNTTLYSNSAPTNGGAITTVGNTATVLYVADTHIADNTTLNQGGALFANAGTLTVERSSFINNRVTDGSQENNGGGVAYLSGTVSSTFRNSTLAGNISARDSGAIETATSGNTRLVNSTLVYNRANFFGGALGLNTPVQMTNTIVAGNSLTTGSSADIVGSVSVAANNWVSNTAGASGISNGVNGNIVAPLTLLAAPATGSNGTRYHALLAGSPAIDAGTSIGAPTTDQIGTLRPQGAGVDIGAVEYVFAPITGLQVTHTAPTYAGLPITFTASLSTGAPAAYTWSFGNGITGTGNPLVNIYPLPGVYPVVVTATNSINTVTATVLVNVQDPNLYAQITSLINGYYVTYTLIVTSPVAQSNVVVTGSLPLTSTLLPGGTNGTFLPGGDYGTGYVSMTVPSLAANQPVTLTWAVQGVLGRQDVLGHARSSGPAPNSPLHLPYTLYRILAMFVVKDAPLGGP